MMVRWQITAVLGLLSAVAITGAALVSETSTIEAEVAERARSVLGSEAMSWATVTVDGRDVVLQGTAPTPELQALAADRIMRLSGVRSVDRDAVGLLPETAPYVVVLERDGGRLTISGSAPSAPDRRRMVEALTQVAPDLAYNDRLRLARGMPDGAFLDVLQPLYPLLADLSSGRIVLQDREIRIAGQAVSNAAYERLSRFRPTLPAGYGLAKPQITRPAVEPFVWSAEARANDVVVSGFAPDAETRAALFGMVRAGAPDKPVIDRVDLASGAPEGFADVALAAADFLDLMDFGRVDVVGTTLALSGRATSPEAWRTLNAHLAAFRPVGYTVEASVQLPVVSPYTLVASRRGARVTVTGFVPGEQDADLVRTAARRITGTEKVIVETTLAAGERENFTPAAVLGITLLDEMSEGTVTITDGRVLVEGIARAGTALIDIRTAVAQVKPEGFDFTLDVTPPVVSPYAWTLQKSGRTLSIVGAVPDESMRSAIRRIVEENAGDLAVADRTILGSGEPEGVDLARVAAFAADRMKALDEGRITLSDKTISVNGRAGDARSGMAVVGAFEGRLPRGVARGIVQVDYPPAFRFHVERDGDRVALTATVSDEAARAALLSAADRAFGAADLTADVAVGGQLPDGADNVALLLTRAAALLSTGEISIDHSIVTIKGRAYTGSGAVRLSSAVAGALPRGYRLETSLGVARSGEALDAAACERALDAEMKQNRIYFETGSAQISPDSHGFLDRIAMTLMLCKDTRVAIEGHTDDEGDAAANQALSESRAKAVRKFLGDVGVDTARLEASGFGAERPVTDNATPEARAANRRIELRVLGGG